MRWRAANSRTSTWAARMAVSSSSSSANNGTCFNSSGAHAMLHLARRSFAKVVQIGWGSDGGFQPALILGAAQAAIMNILGGIRIRHTIGSRPDALMTTQYTSGPSYIGKFLV